MARVSEHTRRVRFSIVDDVVRGLKRDGLNDDEVVDYIAAAVDAREDNVQAWIAKVSMPSNSAYLRGLVKLRNELFPNKPKLSVAQRTGGGGYSIQQKVPGDGPTPLTPPPPPPIEDTPKEFKGLSSFAVKNVEPEQKVVEIDPQLRKTRQAVERAVRNIDVALIEASRRALDLHLQLQESKSWASFFGGVTTGVFVTIGICLVAYYLR